MSEKWAGAAQPWDEAVLLHAFREEFKTLATTKETVAVELSPLQMWVLLATIQLACRHPLFRGATRTVVEGIAQDLQRRVASRGALAEVAERGWQRRYDQGNEGP